MNYKELFKRLFLLISSPAKAWEEIRVEEDKQKVLSGFVYPFVGLCALAVFLGHISFGTYDSLSLKTAIAFTCAVLVGLVGGFFLSVYIVNHFGMALLHRESEREKCQQLVGYSMSVFFVLDIVFGIFPSFFILRWILQFYVVWVVWAGAQKLMVVEESKLMTYTLVVSVIMILAPFILQKLFVYLSVSLS